MNIERIIITTGGTGGHIFPALAVAEEVRRRNPKAMILFMGGKYGQEADLAAKAKLDFVGLPVRGIVGRGLRGGLAAVGMVRAIAKAAIVMRKVKPQVVVGFGGYAAFAGVLAAKLKGLPTALHEQNAIPGRTNKVLGRLVDRVFLSLPDAEKAFPDNKILLTGNPVREAIASLYTKQLCDVEKDSCAAQDNTRPWRLLIMGGSLGAQALNEGIVNVLSSLLAAGVEIWHQTGKKDYETVRQAYREAGAAHARVDAFIGNMPLAYQWADLAVCRAGGSSLAELAVVGLPAILVPFPFATYNHQFFNARSFVDNGAALLLDQAEFTGADGNCTVLGEAILTLLKDYEQRCRMATAAREMAHPQAAQDIVDALCQLVQ